MVMHIRHFYNIEFEIEFFGREKEREQKKVVRQQKKKTDYVVKSVNCVRVGCEGRNTMKIADF